MKDRVEAQQMESPNGRKHILVVDDDQAITAVISFLLKAEGFRVTTARSGEESLERVSEESPDVIILDALMPGLDGYQVCRLIKGCRKTRESAVIFYSARNHIGDIEKAFAAGAADYLVKPACPEKILDSIRRHLP